MGKNPSKATVPLNHFETKFCYFYRLTRSWLAAGSLCGKENQGGCNNDLSKKHNKNLFFWVDS
jgi:hypothetical protein